MKKFLKIFFFLLAIFYAKISEAKIVLHSQVVVSQITASDFLNRQYEKIEISNFVSDDFAFDAAKTSTSLGAGRTGVKQWLQNAGNLERGQLIKDIEGAGFKKVFDDKEMMHFKRGGMTIRLDPPQQGTPFNHMHLELGKKKLQSSYDIFLNRVPSNSPNAHIRIK